MTAQTPEASMAGPRTLTKRRTKKKDSQLEKKKKKPKVSLTSITDQESLSKWATCWHDLQWARTDKQLCIRPLYVGEYDL